MAGLHRFGCALFILFVTLAASGCQQPAAKANEENAQTPGPDMNVRRVTGSYIVTLQAGESERAIQKTFAEFGIVSVKTLGENRFSIRFAHDPGPDGVTKRAQRDPAIKAVQPDYLYRQFRAPK